MRKYIFKSALALIILGIIIVTISLLAVAKGWGAIDIWAIMLAAGLTLMLIGFLIRAIQSEIKISKWFKRQKPNDD